MKIYDISDVPAVKTRKKFYAAVKISSLPKMDKKKVDPPFVFPTEERAGFDKEAFKAFVEDFEKEEK